MGNMFKILLALGLTTSSAWASSSRFLDGQFITNGANTLTIPAATDTLVGKATTDVLTNKSISGSANTLTNISLTASVTGILPMANGGTGASSFTANGILYGAGGSPLSVTAAGSQYNVLTVNGSSVPVFGQVNLAQSAAVVGILGVVNGGSGLAALTAHDVLVGNGTSAVSLISPSTAGFVLTSNGTGADPTFQAAASGAPALNGSAGSPQAVTAAGGIVLASQMYANIAWVVGSPGAVTITATPSITAGSNVGEVLTVIGTSNTNTVTLQDEANLASSTMQLNGNWVGAKYSALYLVWDGSFWNEVSRR